MRKKYNKRLVTRICKMISSDKVYTIDQICDIVGISTQYYYYLQLNKPEFREKVQEARNRFDAERVAECKRSLKKLVTGYELTLISSKKVVLRSGRTYFINTIITKHIPPCTRAIIWFLSTRDPEYRQNKIFKVVTGKDGKDLIPARLLMRFEAENIGLTLGKNSNESK